MNISENVLLLLASDTFSAAFFSAANSCCMPWVWLAIVLALGQVTSSMNWELFPMISHDPYRLYQILFLLSKIVAQQFPPPPLSQPPLLWRNSRGFWTSVQTEHNFLRDESDWPNKTKQNKTNNNNNNNTPPPKKKKNKTKQNKTNKQTNKQINKQKNQQQKRRTQTIIPRPLVQTVPVLDDRLSNLPHLILSLSMSACACGAARAQAMTAGMP